MTVRYLCGDPLLTQSAYLAFGYNARARSEVGALETALLTRYPAAFASYRRAARKGRVKAGAYWLWSDSQPKLLFLTVRLSNVGATRLRYVQAVLLALARDYRREGITSLAIARVGNAHEWAEIRRLIDIWLNPIALPVMVYEEYLPNVRADEGV